MFANAPELSYNDDVLEDLEGILYIHDLGYGIIRGQGFLPTDKDVFMHKINISRHNLKNGDIIFGKVKLVQDGRPKIMTDIISVNGVGIDNHVRSINFDDEKYEKLQNKIIFPEDAIISNLFEFNMLEGGRYLFLSKDKSSTDLLKDFSKSFDDQYSVYSVNLKSMPEEADKTTDNVSFIHIPFSVNDVDLICAVDLVVEKAKRDVESGKKVIVIVNKITSLIRAFNNFENKDYLSSLKVTTIHRMNNFMVQSKNINKNSNLTLIAIDGEDIESNYKEFIYYDFASLFNGFSVVDYNKNKLIKIKQ